MSMKTIISVALVLLCSHTESYPYINEVLKTFSLEEVIPLTVDFYPEDLDVQWISDNEYILKHPISGILKYDVDTNKYTDILDERDIQKIGNFSITLTESSPDLKYLLLVGHKRKLYRYSSTGEYWIYDLDGKNLSRLGEGPLQVVIWSKRQTIAYVKDNNVFYVPDVKRPDQVIQLTTDGVPGKLYHGVPDWLYEEEMFNAAEAMWFSNNGKYLAVASFNDKEVDSVEIPYYGKPSDLDHQYPETEYLKFPKAGRKNPQVILRIFKLDDVQSEPWNIPAPVDLVGLDHYLGRVNWASDHNVIVLWLNRRQNVSVLVNCDLERDKCSIVIEHTEPNGWIDVTTPLLDKSGNRMVEIQNLYNGDQRFAHAAKFNFQTLTTEDLSPGNSTVTEIVGWNQDIDTVYFIVSPGNTPWMRQMWATSGGIVRCITCRQPACHSVTHSSFSSLSKYAIIKCSSIYIPPKIYLYNTLQDKFTLLKDNARLKDLLKQYQLPYSLFNVVSLGEHVLAHVKLLLPPNMASGVQYPMIVRVYSGPSSSRVTDYFDVEYYNSYLATNRSFIVASIDVRGSGYMGVEAMHAVNNALGTVEITDTLLAIKSLISVYSFIDPTRIGVWGWSYGGFASTMMLIKDEERLLSCAAAVAPVTSWLYYDTMYTERYMDTPQANPAGYENSDLIKHAEKIRGRRYLLAHGTKDDNTHFQHSIQLAKQLQRSDIDFEQMSYADEEHSLLHVSRHFYHMLDRFWTRCFNKNL